MVRTQHFHYHDSQFDPGWGNKVSQATWYGQKIKRVVLTLPDGNIFEES